MNWFKKPDCVVLPIPEGITRMEEIRQKDDRFCNRTNIDKLQRAMFGWWRTLSPWGESQKPDFYTLREVHSISPSYPCPNNEHTLRGRYHPFTPLHGAKVTLGEQVYPIGQSPVKRSADVKAELRLQSYSDALAYALESRQGLVQIVSDKTHQLPGSTHTIAGMLDHVLNATQHTRSYGKRLPAMKGGALREFSLVGVTEIKTKADPFLEGFYRQYTIKLRNDSPSGHGKTFEIPLTQIGLPFEKGRLEAADIRRGSQIVSECHAKFRDHMYKYASKGSSAGAVNCPTNEGPLLLSKFGHGRNATLTAYLAISKKINSREIRKLAEIQTALRETINIGRAARPYFVHSCEQARQLQIALECELAKFEMGLQAKEDHDKIQLYAVVCRAESYVKKCNKAMKEKLVEMQRASDAARMPRPPKSPPAAIPPSD